LGDLNLGMFELKVLTRFSKTATLKLSSMNFSKEPLLTVRRSQSHARSFQWSRMKKRASNQVRRRFLERGRKRLENQKRIRVRRRQANLMLRRLIVRPFESLKPLEESLKLRELHATVSRASVLSSIAIAFQREAFVVLSVDVRIAITTKRTRR